MTDQQPNDKNSELPSLKNGLTISFSQYDKQGKPQWVIHDSGRNKFFIIGWLEYEILHHWDLKNPESIINAVNTKTTLNIDASDIESVLDFLKRNYLIQQSSYEINKLATEQNLFKGDNIIHWLTSHYLFFKIPLWKCDPFLTKTKEVANWIFSRNLLYIMLVLGVIAFYRILMNWDNFIHSFPNLISWHGLFLYFIAFTITKFIHELGHAYMCKRYGVPVPTMGVAFLVFWPVLYTDTTLSWYLESRQRMRIAFAGIWMETYVVIIAALLWGITGNETLKTICFITITVNWIASLLINVSPFMRFDGYFILADYLQMPNLQPRAFALTRWQIRKWLFNWQDPPPEKFTTGMHYFLVFYSLFTWLYRLVLYLGIALLVYHYFFKLLGIILFIIEIYYFILAPIVFELKFWLASKEKFHWNIHSILTVAALATLLLIFILPIRQTIVIPATLSYAHQFLYAPTTGVLLTPLPHPNSIVKKDQVIAQLSSPELYHTAQLLVLEYQKKMRQLRRAEINKQFVSEKNILLSDLNQQRSEYKRLEELAEKLNIRAPFNGILIDIATELRPGEVVAKDEWIADVINTQEIHIEGFVPQYDLKKIYAGATGHFYPSDPSLPELPVIVQAIEAINVQFLNCQYAHKIQKNQTEDVAVDTPCYNASELGGIIPTFQSEKNEYIPANSVYRVILNTKENVRLPYLLRGTVKINTTRNSYLNRFVYWLKKTIAQESDV